jgi:hypothetical protein
MSINVLDGAGGYDGKVSPRYLQRVVNRIVKYFTDTPVDSRPYKVYSALLSQTGTSAPTSVILENTFPSAIVWAFSSAGSFVGTLTAAFVENKTQCWIEQSSTDTAPGTSFKRIVRTGANTVQIDCSDVEGNPLNDVIVDTPIEIRVYN